MEARRVIGWDPVDLAQLEERPKVQPSLGGLGLAYPGRRHIVSGAPESAKTLTVYVLAIEEIRAGGRVVLIDFETGPWDARDRLRDLGATDAELADLLYVEPSTEATPEVIRALADREPTLVVIDAAAGAYANLHLDDNRRDDVETFAAIYVHGFWAKGIATVLVDHVPKNGDTRGRFAIGSERKLGAADVHLGVEVIVPLHRGGRGLYRIVVHKDRLGHLARPVAAELELVSDPATHRISWTLSPAEAHDATPGATWQPTVLMERVSRFVAEQPEPPSLRTVEDGVRGKSRKHIRQAIDELLAGGYLTETRGVRNARILSSARPYATSPDLAATSPGEVRDDLAHLAPSLQRGEVRGELPGEDDDRAKSVPHEDARRSSAVGGRTSGTRVGA